MSDEDEGDEHVTYETVFPLICVRSNGGPLDDEAFIAGIRYGQIHAALEDGSEGWQGYIETLLVKQVDLLAMHFGYLMVSGTWADDERWSLIHLTKLIEEKNDT
jgi:hypothetical protein